jgi:hypothetical protein
MPGLYPTMWPAKLRAWDDVPSAGRQTTREDACEYW